MNRLFSLPVLYALAGSLSAQSPVPIEDATSSAAIGRTPVNSGVTVTPISQAASNNAELLYTLQLLQQEVQELRGMVEQQAYQIKRMEEEQRDRYLDLDRRLSMSNSNATEQPAVSTGNQVPIQPTTTAGDDRTAYQQAFDLIRDKEYDRAVSALMRFTQNYPDSSYTGNAYYWLGEVQLV